MPGVPGIGEWRSDPRAGWATPAALGAHTHVGTDLLNGAVLVATSTTRPPSPVTGQVVFETDTNLLMVWTGTEWRRAALPGVAVLSTAAFSVGNTASNTYVDAPGPVDLAFTKRSASTSLLLDVRVSCYVGTAANAVTFGLRINAVDQGVAFNYFNNASTHAAFSGVATAFSNLASGTYTARLRWLSNGAVTINTDTNDRVAITIQETTAT
jgi:hypothetical protein